LGSELKYVIPSWEQIYVMLLNLAKRIRKDDFRPDVIVGVSRGGWPAARVMSDLLENPNLASVKVDFYLGVAETGTKPKITQPVSISVEEKRVLIVDDVADTGESLNLVKAHIKKRGAEETKTITICYKPWSILVPDYYEEETTCWIVFPWERKESVRNIMKKCRKEGKSFEKEKERLLESGFDNKLLERFIREISGETC
jgi:hypoxanthine phosphoribosyltransferase